MTKRVLLLSCLAAILVALWVANCSGPRPEVTKMTLIRPRAAGTPYVLSAAVHNGGPGHGTVNVRFVLRNTVSDVIQSQKQSVTLSSGESAVVSAQFDAPLATYTPVVTVEYPQR